MHVGGLGGADGGGDDERARWLEPLSYFGNLMVRGDLHPPSLPCCPAALLALFAQGRQAVGPLEKGSTTVMVHNSSDWSLTKRTARFVLGLQLCVGEHRLDVLRSW